MTSISTTYCLSQCFKLLLDDLPLGLFVEDLLIDLLKFLEKQNHFRIVRLKGLLHFARVRRGNELEK